MRIDSTATVMEVLVHSPAYYTLVLAAPPVYRSLRAGQFVMVKVSPGQDPYLRRPFSVLEVREDAHGVTIDLVIKIVGKGTALLATKRRGDPIDILGPLGRPFRLERAAPGERVAVVAGGIGCAPFLLLGRELAARGVGADYYYGGRGRDDLVRFEDFVRVYAQNGETLLATEDGSLGFAGRVTELLEPRLARRDYAYVYACGPAAMLGALARLAAAHGVAGEVSMESPMGCGFGTCMGCVIPHTDGHFATVCAEGTVFGFEEIAWAKLAAG